MNKASACALLIAPLFLAACGKKTVVVQPPTVVVAPAPAAPPAAANPAAAASAPAPMDPEKMTDAQRELADKQAKLAFGTMEDKYLNDARAQWGASASASSTYKEGDSESKYHQAANATGVPDGKEWSNNKDDMGFDWIELTYAKPVNATEVRLVLDNRPATEALNKVELQDTDGKWFEIWSGISEVTPEKNGPRTWFVRSFPKTAYKVKAVKYTFANNVSHGYKEVDAAQLVGD